MTRTEWAKQVKAWRTSGLTAKAYAQREGLNAGTLRWWSSRLRDESSSPAFIEVALPEPVAPASIEVLVGQATLRVQRGFDPDLLRELVSALGAR